MSMKFRNVLGVAFATMALGASAGAWAGPGGALQKLHDGQSQQQSQDNKSDDRPQQARPAPAPARAPNTRFSTAAQSRAEHEQPHNDGRGNNSIVTDAFRHDLPNNGNRYGYGGHGRPGPGYNNRPPQVIQTLPRGYRNYNWNGNRYYFYGGRWYRPYGASYIAIGVPFGLFVGALPGYYTSFWFGGTRYFYADDTYYLYDGDRRGYVVTRSPYADDSDEDSGSTQGDDLYIYPARGQSEQQQADDRYECHRWAVDQSHYDPLDDEYDAARRDEYQRAMTACLTGRGYTVN